MINRKLEKLIQLCESWVSIADILTVICRIYFENVSAKVRRWTKSILLENFRKSGKQDSTVNVLYRDQQEIVINQINKSIILLINILRNEENNKSFLIVSTTQIGNRHGENRAKQRKAFAHVNDVNEFRNFWRKQHQTMRLQWIQIQLSQHNYWWVVSINGSLLHTTVYLRNLFWCSQTP